MHLNGSIKRKVMTVITFRLVEVYAEKRTVHRIMRFAPLPLLFSLSAIALQILTTCPTQEFVGQSHDQNQTFPLGQTSPRQNKISCLIEDPIVMFSEKDLTSWLNYLTSQHNISKVNLHVYERKYATIDEPFLYVIYMLW